MKLFAKKKTYILICDSSLYINACRFAMSCAGIKKASVTEDYEFCMLKFNTKKSFSEWCESFYDAFGLCDMSWVSDRIIRVKEF